jgi:regulator of nucleoside diphosphate kinase
MQEKPNRRGKPGIVVGKIDHERLTKRAASVAERMPEISEELVSELDRARVVPDASVPEDIVRIGSAVAYRTDTGDERTVTLVYPGQADISAGKVSILTPIGTALIGLKTGQSISWTARDGHRHELTILTVGQPLAE